MSERKRRVRFAPSPTGPLHMGGVRTALYNYLYTKQVDGDFILRIEDTDSQRFVPGAEKYIIDSLRWCGIYPNEGVDLEGNVVEVPSTEHPHAPYRQSQRKHIYKAYADQLIENGYAYYAFDLPEELDVKRKEAEANKSVFIYNYQTRKELKNSLTLPADEVKRLLETTNNWTIRFKIPEDQTVAMDDLIRGHIEVNTSTLDDKVLWKCIDQLPTYHLANIVDDHLMEITEVIRGEEWLPSLPLHYLLYKAFGWQETQPQFAHLSLLLKPDGKGKLSKRDGDRLGFPVFPLEWINPEGEISRGYREDGYYPEAFINMLALLGWNPGTEQELFTVEELIPIFSLDRVIKSGAKFNPEKAKWFNQEYLRKQTDQQLAEQFLPYIKENGAEAPLEYITLLCGLIKERAHFVKEFWGICSYFFIAPKSYNDADIKKFWNTETKQIIEKVKSHIQGMEFIDFPTNYKQLSLSEPAESLSTLQSIKAEQVSNIEHQLTGFIKENGFKMGTVMNTLRLFFVGEAKGLGIADIIWFLGKEESLNRINQAIKTIEI